MTTAPPIDPAVFGWDPTPGIVSVWADRDGRALVWRREGERVACERERYRPWLFARTLADVAHLGPSLAPDADGAGGGGRRRPRRGQSSRTANSTAHRRTTATCSTLRRRATWSAPSSTARRGDWAGVWRTCVSWTTTTASARSSST
ncbi:MAG: hypothetical protein U0470_00070 [Anaerolineae bacterium]